MIEAHGTYHDIFTSLFQNSLVATTSDKSSTTTTTTTGDERFELVIESYDAVSMKLPGEERVREADGVLITGSGMSLVSLSYSSS